MVTLVNTRDVILQSAPTRSTDNPADSAQAAADAAQAAADAAQAAADAAQADANTAQTDANTAQTDANTAQAAADAAQSDIDDPTTGLAQRMRLNGDNILGGILTADTIASPAGFRAGNVVWDASGDWVSGSGVAMTPKGLVGYNSFGVAQFSINASTGAATFGGTLTAGAIDAVNTINIAGEAVTIPRTESRTDTISGIGSDQNVMTKSITLTEDGTIQVICTCSQSSGSGPHGWQLYLYIDSTQVSFAGGSAPADSVALSGAMFLTAGTYDIDLVQNSGSDSRVIDRNFTILGAMR